jgi:hypothetical protein
MRAKIYKAIGVYVTHKAITQTVYLILNQAPQVVCFILLSFWFEIMQVC